ncbi:MAG: cation diffusion facilitator family transporter [Dehalococcoidales bacterium]|nr:cation diffusion facilitator family transporter [Dehalococcoidales bacterium]
MDKTKEIYSKEHRFSTKAGATKLLLGTVIGLIVLKAAVGWLTGSISILAQSADSLLDLFAAIITFSAIRIADKPADEEHPYGHGKVEDIAGATQGVLIFIAGALIIFSSIRRIMEGSRIEMAETGIGVMLVSIVVSIFLSRHLSRVARATGSPVLEANARNIAADVYSALAVLVGLIIVRITGLNMIDSVLAIGMAGYILFVAYRTVRNPLLGLVDTKLSHSQENIIRYSLMKHSNEVVSYHALRTRRAGSQRYIDLHLVMAQDISLQQAHSVCDQIEAEIHARLPRSSIIIHTEPCSNECQQCAIACSRRQI